MATGADWMSAASFIGMAGTLYLTGYGGLAFIMGWTGGYCLVALFLAPYLRKFGQFTIPDFLGARFGGNIPRFVGIVAAILCSFTYVVAQIYGVGLITTRLTGVAFEIGIFLGLGGILVCSFLGGMRAVTWTQVAQYIILIVAYMIPVVWLSIKHTGVPVPQLVYGKVLEKVTATRAAADRRPEGEGGARDLQGARRRREREPRESQGVRRGQGEARGRGRRGQDRERAGEGRHRRGRAEGLAGGRRGGEGRSGPRTRERPRVPRRRCVTPRRSRARTTRRATFRGGTSSR